MKLEAHGLELDSPDGWEARITQRVAEVPGEVEKPVVHAATFPLPEERGDYGSGAVELMGHQDVFVALVEWESELADTPLFSRQAMPRVLDPDAFATNQLQRWIPGHSGLQTFFTEGGRPFCLYVVLGSHQDRETLVRVAERLIATISIDSIYPPGVA